MAYFWSTAVLATALAPVVFWAWPLYRNYRRAVATGFPVVLCPWNHHNLVYQVLKVPFRHWFEGLFPLYGVRMTMISWEFRDKYRMHEKLGPVIIVVTAACNEVWCADPAMTQIVATRRKDFVMPPFAAKIMSFLGQNLVSTNGEDWARQRRIVAPALNERISEVVWRETLTQARQMVSFMLSKPGGASEDTNAGLKAIAMGVLSQVAYGKQVPFKPLSLPDDLNAKISYVDGISICADRIVFASLMPDWMFRLPRLPNFVRIVKVVRDQLPAQTADMLEEERLRQRKVAGSEDARENIMSALVRLSDLGKAEKGQGGQFLSEDEIRGNLFLFTAAGFDTTANTMCYAFAMLAARPEWQAWIQEEIDEVLGGARGLDGEEEPDYATVFPRLKRCLALMFEILRILPAVPHVTRGVAQDQVINLESGPIHLPAPMDIYLNSMALQTLPSIWGPDSLEFRPTRWINQDGSLLDPPRGTFLPWSMGPRVCPGMKMAQVEFVTVIAGVFGRCRIEPLLKEGESLAEGRSRMLDLMEDSEQRITLQFNKPEEVKFRWMKR